MTHITYMERALELAAEGREWVSPNPMVGCVIVHDGKIIGEGFHQKYGHAHAEVNAIQNVADKTLLPESIVYVTLEPCSHFGKTPPCTELLIRHRVKKVVICNPDPFPEVAGRGIARLQAAGIATETGILAEKGEELNKRFFKVHRTGLPYVILKWAETADGFISGPEGAQRKISNSVTDLDVHRWRAEEDAILIGKNTLLNDNPRLNVRHWTDHKQPVRVVLASGVDSSVHRHIFDHSQKTLIYNREISKTEGNTEYIATTALRDILLSLREKGINSLLVEGGLKIHTSFIQQQLFDEIRVIKSSILMNNGTPARTLPPGIVLKKNKRILNDQLFFYRTIPTF